MRERSRDFRVVGRGSDLALEARGADAAGCLDAVVAAFGASLAEVDEEAPRERSRVALRVSSGEGLLVELIEECILAVDAEGLLPVGLSDATVERTAGDWTLQATLLAVPLGGVEIHGAAPKAATWHDVRLAPSPTGWDAYVMLDI